MTTTEDYTNLYIDRDGTHLEPNDDDPRWKAYLANIAQTSMAIFQMFGTPGIESHKDYMGVVSIAVNLFMLDTPEKKAAYMEALSKKILKEQNKDG